MDASTPQHPGEADTLSSPPGGKQPWLLRRSGLPFALGACLTIAAIPVTSIVGFIHQSLIQNSPYYYQHQTDLAMITSIITALFLPVVILFVAAVFALRGPAESRPNSLLRLAVALLIFIVLAWTATLLQTALYELQVGHSPFIYSSLPPFLWSYLVPGLWQGLSLGLLLIILVRLVAPWLPLGNAGSRAASAALIGALAGLVVSFYMALNRLILNGIIAARLAYDGVTGCSGGSGGGCFPGQLWQISWGIALPIMAGAALGAIIGAFLIPALRTAPEPAAASPSAQATPESASRRRRLVWAVVLIACAAIGALDAYLTWQVIGHAKGVLPSTNFQLTLPILALVLPTGLFALFAARARLARALGPTGIRLLLAGIVVVGALVGIGTPLTLLFQQQLIEAAPLDAIVLVPFCLGAALAAIVMLFASTPTWRTGWRAAAFGWLGFSIFVAVIIVQTFYGYVIPGPTTFDCHGLGCGGLYLAVVGGVINFAFELIIYGFPAALLAGGLVCALGAALRAPSTSAPSA